MKTKDITPELEWEEDYYKTYIKNYFPEKSGIYVLKFSGSKKGNIPSGVKIGKSVDLKGRIREYLHPWCRNIEKFEYFVTENFSEAEKLTIEKCRKTLSNKHGNSEYFEFHNGRDIFTSICSYVRKSIKEIEKEPHNEQSK